jgi:hypothetical protein
LLEEKWSRGNFKRNNFRMIKEKGNQQKNRTTNATRGQIK